MNQNDKYSKPIVIYGLPDSSAVPAEKGVMHTQPPLPRQAIVLDPQCPGDRRRLAQLLAAIAWRLAKEQAAKDVVSSEEQPVYGFGMR
jgi:hypothetical protein